MKKSDDRIIYISFIIATLSAALIIASISLYSRISVEPRIQSLLSSEDYDPEALSDAYLLLRKPQFFAGYKYWDSQGIPVRNSLRYFDNKIFHGRHITAEEKPYLYLLFDRRKAGSSLGLKTSVFFMVFSAIGFAAYLLYRRSD